MPEEDTPLLRNPSNDAQSVHADRAERGRDVSESGDDPTKSFKVLALTILPMAIGVFLSSMDSTIVVSSYASIGSELNQLQNTSWISTGYMLTLASFQPLYGKLSDIFGRKPCLLFAYVIFGLGCLSCGLARSMNELIFARAIAGVGGGGMSTIVSIVMSDIIPLRSRGTWQGLINIVWASGSATGAPLGGLLSDSIGWRWAFLLQVPLTAIAFVAVASALQVPKPESADLRSRLRRVDFGGAFCLVFTVLTLLVGLDRGGNISWNDVMTQSALAAFGVFFVAFIVVETRLAREPFAPTRIVANSNLLASYLCNFFGIASAIATVFYVSLYLQAVRNGSAAYAGMALMPSIVSGTLGSLTGGLIMQATGKYHLLTIINYVIMLSGSTLIIFSTGLFFHSFVGLEIGLFLLAYGNGTTITSTLIALIAHAGAADQAIATAVSYLFRSLGSVLGLSISSTLFQHTLRQHLRRRLPAVGGDADEIMRRVRQSLTYIEELSPAARSIVQSSYEQALRVSFFFGAALAACALFSSFFIKEKPLVRPGRD
ncbi:MFS general substrate transporter [Auriscalpium vulgare]|uniref:MFS general substrate transporter n=1 Tax=Auriscalpium vulgare TaxID=40419 RepID=A0ACB8RM55_9AGAM|nr:MFS general substrate transporter [Auriscalpium vulgare]